VKLRGFFKNYKMSKIILELTNREVEYSIYGSAVVGKNVLKLFGSPGLSYDAADPAELPKLLADIPETPYSDSYDLADKLDEVYANNTIHSKMTEPIFKKLVEAYAYGRRDESIHLAARFVDSDILKQLPPGILEVAVADENELAIAKIACKCITYLQHGHIIPHIDQGPLHQCLHAINPNLKIHVMTAAELDKMPKFLKSLTIDDRQMQSAPPPIGIIPNNGKLCYAVATLTVLLSIPSFAEIMKNERPKEGMDFFNVLRTYSWFLANDGFPQYQIERINQIFVTYPGIDEFAHGEADDAVTFLEVILKLFKRYSPRCFRAIQKVYYIPSLVLVDTDILTTSQTEGGPVVTGHSMGNRWTCEYTETEQKVCQKTREIFIYKTPKITGTIDEIVSHVIGRDELPDVLFLCQAIDVSKEARICIIPCDIVVRGTHYSFHGAAMFDNKHTDGHYIGLVMSETTMYFYDSQYRKNCEDPREYQPRLLCYSKIRI